MPQSNPDGEPDEVKVSCPVLSGGKSGDNIKGLPIAIFAQRGADGGLLRGNLEKVPKMGRDSHWHHAEREGFAVQPRGGKYL